ncbi:MAG: type IV secretion system protein [Burkholderia sp.]
MGGVLDQYKAAAAQFSGTVATAAAALAFSLFLIDSLLTYFKKLASGAEWPEMVFTLAFKMLLLGIIVFLLNPNNVFKPIMDSFQLIGQRGSGLGGIEPTDLFFQGVALVKAMWSSFSANNPGLTVSGSAIAKTVMVGVLMALVSLVIIISYAILAMSVVAIFVEMYFYLAVSPLLVAFGAIRFTRDFISKAVTTSIVIGFRFLGIYFVCKVASVLANEMAPQLAQITVDNLDPIWLVVGTSMLLGFLALKIPTMVSNIVNGTSSLGASDVVGAGVAAAAGVAAGVAAGAAGIGALASAAGAGAGGASAAGAAAGGAAGAGGASAAGSSAAGVSGLGGIGSGASGASGGGAGAGAGTSAASASPPPPTPPSGAGGQAGGGSTPKEPSPPSQPGDSASGSSGSSTPSTTQQGGQTGSSGQSSGQANEPPPEPPKSGPTATQRIADAVRHVEQQTDAPPAQPGSVNPGHEE